MGNKAVQSALLVQCRTVGTPLTIGSGGRADGPGHYVKYGSHRIIDLTTNMQLIQVCMHVILIACAYAKLLLQSNEVKSSNHMEKEGLARTLNFLQANCLEIGTLITDRQHK